MDYINKLSKDSKNAFYEFSKVDTKKKNEILNIISYNIIKNKDKILKENQKDIESYSKFENKKHLLKRLILDDKQLENIAENIKILCKMEDPVGIIENGKITENGLEIIKKRVPFGVIGIIYESRPNVTIDSACLCIKSGNCCILKGGKEAINTNKSIIEIIKFSLEEANVNPNIVNLIEDNSRECVSKLIKLDQYIDLIIPRGGQQLISHVKLNSTVPIIETGLGNCHLFVDEYAEFEMAKNIIENAKTSKPFVCNSIESLLIHEYIAYDFLPLIYDTLEKYNIEIFCCNKSIEILKDKPLCSIANDEHFMSEFLDYKISLKIVKDLHEAIDHINKYSTKHSECIVTNNIKNANIFAKCIDSAVVHVNSSTRFTDGEMFGFGAEIGISTQKLHVRGPMGLKELTTNKYIVIGNGHIRN